MEKKLIIRFLRYAGIAVGLTLIRTIVYYVAKYYSGTFAGLVTGWVVGIMSYLLVDNQLSREDKQNIRYWIRLHLWRRIIVVLGLIFTLMFVSRL